MKNRRRDKRYRFRENGTIDFEGGRIQVETLNLSIGGARITLDRPLLDGAEVGFSLAKADVPGLTDVPGNVVWCSEGIEVGFEAGISFSLDAPTAEKLEGYLKDRSD